jgi:hypothetical protein
MARHVLTKEQKIKGCEKALANPKTPKAFIPSLKKRLKQLLAVVAFVICFPAISHAQFTGYTTPQTVTQTLAPAGTACTGVAQTFITQNLGQTQHYAYIRTNSSVSNLVMQIQGVDAGGNVYVISDTSTSAIPIAGNNSALLGSGYFPKTQIVVTCLPSSTGTFNLNYTGTSATSNQIVGSYLISQQDKTIGSAAPAGTTYFAVFQTPFGNSFGTLSFQYTGTGPAGSALSVVCQTQNGTGPGSYGYTLAVTSALAQNFVVPPGSCPNITVQYTTGGASAATYLLDYVFVPPGGNITSTYTHVTTTTATIVKAGPGTVQTLVVGTPVTGTFSFFDLVSGSCTGTPAANVVSVVNETAANPPASIPFVGPLFLNGICVKASVAGDYTVVSQ